MPLQWMPGEQGTGTLLMITEGLSRRDGGRPHQPLFCFDEQSRPTRLVTNEDGAPLGYDSRDGELVDDLDRLIVLPEDVAAAAKRWLADQLAGRPLSGDSPPACPTPEA